MDIRNHQKRFSIFAGMEIWEQHEKLLVTELSQGNPDAFRKLFMHYYPKVRYFIIGLLKSEEEADDLAQEVFVKVWSHRGQFSDVKTFGAYLFILTKNTVFTYMASRQLHKMPDSENRNLIDERQATPYEELVAKDLQLLIDLIVESMPRQRRTVFQLSRTAGLSNDEIAEKLHLSKKTVENHLNLALKELRNALLFHLILYLC